MKLFAGILILIDLLFIGSIVGGYIHLMFQDKLHVITSGIIVLYFIPPFLAIFSIITTILYFKKASIAKTLIILLLSVLSIPWFVFIIISIINNMTNNIINHILVLSLIIPWIIYFIKSKQVSHVLKNKSTASNSV